MEYDRDHQAQVEAEDQLEFEQQMSTRPQKHAPRVVDPEVIPASNPNAPIATPRVVPPEPIRSIDDLNDSNGR
jgi:hypothetical protein